MTVHSRRDNRAASLSSSGPDSPGPNLEGLPEKPTQAANNPLLQAAGGYSSAPFGSDLSLDQGLRQRRPRGSWCKWLAACAVLAAGGAIALLWAASVEPSATEFITTQGTQFMQGCRVFHPVGFNLESLAQAAYEPVGATANEGEHGGRRRLASHDAISDNRHKVDELLRTAAQAGLNVMRTWAHTTDPKHPLQVKPGVYDESTFRALDYVLWAAQRAGLRVMLSMVDTWKHAGGMDEFVDWCGPARDKRYPPIAQDGDVDTGVLSDERRVYEDKRKALFYSESKCKEVYKKHVAAILDRKNTYTGVRYKDDPTIFSWGLLNEPRCAVSEVPACATLLGEWAAEMAEHVKSLDSRHLVTIGEEGFWGPGADFKGHNPGEPSSDWASQAGQDFLRDHASPHIDFATVHLWPDNWNEHHPAFQKAWLEKHAQDAANVLKKPLLLEEFGKSLPGSGLPEAAAVASDRDPVYELVSRVVQASVAQGQALAGSLFWRWGFNHWDAQQPGDYGVLPGQSTFEVARRHAQAVKSLQNAAPPLPGCRPQCWVGSTSIFGNRRCERSGATCTRQWSHPTQAWQDGQLVVEGVEVFGSKASCCQPGLGAFQEGCSGM